MQHLAKQIAIDASYQAFVNSYFREVDGGFWQEKQVWLERNTFSGSDSGSYLVELYLPKKAVTFAFFVEYRSLAGRHKLGTPVKFCPFTKKWQVENKLTVLLELVQEMHFFRSGEEHRESHYEELILRLMDSLQTMTKYVEARGQDNTLYLPDSSFIETEQSLVFGHWFHPTPKSRQGMANWQHDVFVPELKGSFQLHWFTADRTIVKMDSAHCKSAKEIIEKDILKLEDKGSEQHVWIPVHPLQAQQLLQQDHVKEAIQSGLLEDIGPIGEAFTATSSVRTVYHSESKWMLKFSIPIKITNSMRVNRSHELKAGIVMSNLLKKISFLEEHQQFAIMEDPAYITLAMPGMKESGFEVIIRSNLFEKGADKGISSIASIVQDPLPGNHSQLYELVNRIAISSGKSLEQTSIEWFEKYWNCAIEPLLKLYDQYGIALEAHQQNSVLDVSNGYPEKYYYRDNQGYYLSNTMKDHLMNIEPALRQTKELFYEDSIIHDRFSYYLFANQLFSVIYRFGADGLLSEQCLLDWVYERLEILERSLSGQGKRMIQKLLQNETLPYKANLLTRFYDVDELVAHLEQAVYTEIENPFVSVKEGNDEAAVVKMYS